MLISHTYDNSTCWQRPFRVSSYAVRNRWGSDSFWRCSLFHRLSKEAEDAPNSASKPPWQVRDHKQTFSRVSSSSGELRSRMDTDLGLNVSRNRIQRWTMISRIAETRMDVLRRMVGSVAEWDANTNRMRTSDECNRT
jgi:hypothetical protein